MPVKIFFCYAHEDELLLNKLKTHLRPLQQQGFIDVWHDGDISAGTEWEQEISQYLNSAQIILLLVSSDFMASDYIYNVELKLAVERHESGEACVIPVILRPVYWQGAPFGKLQALPKDGKPVIGSSWHSQDEAFYNIEEGIRKAINKLVAPPSIVLSHKAFLVTMPRTLEFSIQQGDITTFNADVLALKYAQAFYGTDGMVADLLSKVGIEHDKLRPEIGEYCYEETQKVIQARHALFVGVPSIYSFDYQEIQKFSARVLEILAKEAPNTNHLVMTMHGLGFGLDEIEAFLAQFAGYLEAMQREQLPPHLEYITVIDKNVDRVKRLRQTLEEHLSHADFAYQVKERWAYRLDTHQLMDIFKRNRGSARMIDRVGIESDAKPYVFVALPSKKDMDDVFYYGIYQPVRAFGFLCEWVDHEAFIGDILDQVKKKIETAAVVIAELSGANPNVYLEVGYAWGKSRPTILLIKDDQELRFDVRSQRCLKYERIRDLEDSLKKELNELKSKGFI
jgi:hypothetical protein